MTTSERTRLPVPRRPAEHHDARVLVRDVGRWATVAQVYGEIDMRTTTTLHQRLDAALDSPDLLLLVLDLSEVDFLGASGLAMLVDLVEHAARRAVGLRLVAAHRVVLRPLTLTGLLERFAVFPTETAAIAPYSEALR
ncbi:MAG: STAS domain-containing protein [Actinomycetota bacterium]|nr:STAS domain-containing protein [Actinomycetota bacterium]